MKTRLTLLAVCTTALLSGCFTAAGAFVGSGFKSQHTETLQGQPHEVDSTNYGALISGIVLGAAVDAVLISAAIHDHESYMPGPYSD